MTPTKHAAATGLRVKSVREPAEAADGERILVDRLWPRGISKERAHLSEWMRDLAPSTELRQWFGHDPARWHEFRKRYREELRDRDQLAALAGLQQRARHRPVTLLYGAADAEHNQAVALREIARDI